MTLVAGQTGGTVDYYPSRGGQTYDPVLNGGDMTSMTIYSADRSTTLAVSSSHAKIADGQYRFTFATAVTNAGDYPLMVVWTATATGPTVTDTNDTVRVEAYGGSMGGLAAFATPAQLASSLGVAVPTDSLILGRWQDALDDASGYLRTLIGQTITAGTATLSLTTDSRGEADIWLVPVTSITSVTDPEGNVLTTDDWDLVDQRLYLRRGNTTYTVVVAYGYTTTPAEIVRWTKVLAATQIQVSANGSLGLSNVSSLAVDDAKISYTDAMAVVMPDSAAQWLKATFGGPQ